jgi:hypothetical protein
MTYTAQALDPEGDALTVVWSLNSTPVQTNSVPVQNPPATVPVTFTGSLPLGTNLLMVAATDTSSNTTTCSATIMVLNTTPPVITSVSANPDVLWPPNHKLVPVTVHAVVTDACGATSWKIVSVTSNEPVTGKGDGNTAPDWLITGPHSVSLRAERSGKGPGRVYSIYVQAVDDAGNLSTKAVVQVTVPHSQGKGKK